MPLSVARRRKRPLRPMNPDHLQKAVRLTSDGLLFLKKNSTGVRAHIARACVPY